jgi:hypothetical protein
MTTKTRSPRATGAQGDAAGVLPRSRGLSAQVRSSPRHWARAPGRGSISRCSTMPEAPADTHPLRGAGGSPRAASAALILAVIALGSMCFGVGSAEGRPGGVIRTGPAGVSYLGSWHVATHGTYREALNALGTPDLVANRPGICTRGWGILGLRILFTTFGGGSACADTFAQAGSIQGKDARHRWRTTRGLRIGDPLATVDRLYPGAIKHRNARVIAYNLHSPVGTGRLDIITAQLAKNHVSSFKLWLGVAGD